MKYKRFPLQIYLIQFGTLEIRIFKRYLMKKIIIYTLIYSEMCMYEHKQKALYTVSGHTS